MFKFTDTSVYQKNRVGYKIPYRYNSDIYSTRTMHDTGESLHLNIIATPATAEN